MSVKSLDELLAPEIDSIEATEPASHARRRMDTNETRSLLVLEENRLAGIIRRNTLLDVNSADLERPVAEFMSRDVPKFRRDQSVQEAHDSLGGDINTEQVPVIDENGEMIGVINRNSLTGAMEPVGGSTQDGAEPIAQLPLENGMTVKASDGSSLGSLSEGDFKADGGVEFIIVEHGLVFKKHKRLPGDLVKGVDDGDLIVNMTSTEFGMISDMDDE